jgi:integrase
MVYQRKKTTTTNSFEDLMNKYTTKDLSKVVDFLSSMNRQSNQTAFCYSFALDHFNRFLEQKYKDNGYNIQTILEPLKNNDMDIGELLDRFVSYLQNDTINAHDLSAKSVRMYVAAARSYLSYYRIEISNISFKCRVKMPRIYHDDEEAVDSNEIKEILHHCNNGRLKAYLLVLASGGMRATEALAIRLKDINDGKGIDLNISPAKITIRKEYAKTKRERYVYISDEATRYLKQWIDWKYRDRHAENKRMNNKTKSDNDLVFSRASSKNPQGLYSKILIEFQKLLEHAGLDSRKEDGVKKRRKITFHSFRRFVKTTIADHHNTDYSEWFLGHSKSPYYTNKRDELRDIYKRKCMKFLEFLDYPTVEATGWDYKAKLEEKDREIEELRRQVAGLTVDVTEIQKFKKELDDLKDLFKRSQQQGND